MRLLLANNSMSVELCVAVAKAQLTAVPATTYLYVGLEYGRECYAATTAPSPEPTQLVGTKACTMTCKGNPTESCGAGNMYNLYASGTSITGTATGTAIWTSAPAVSTKA
jgi:iron transport multicopper oxidase